MYYNHNTRRTIGGHFYSLACCRVFFFFLEVGGSCWVTGKLLFSFCFGLLAWPCVNLGNHCIHVVFPLFWLLLSLSCLHVALRPVMESHGECEIKVQLNCSHCETQSCKRDEDTQLVVCICHNEEVLTSDNVTCVSPLSEYPDGHVSPS